MIDLITYIKQLIPYYKRAEQYRAEIQDGIELVTIILNIEGVRETIPGTMLGVWLISATETLKA